MERIDKYSFAALYEGKWGDGSDDSDDLERRSTEDVIDPRLVGLESIPQTVPPKKKKVTVKQVKKRGGGSAGSRLKQGRKSLDVADDYSWEKDFECLKCGSKVESNF